MTAGPLLSSTLDAQLEIVLDRIYSSRDCFIRVVKHLLAEYRAERGASRTSQLDGRSSRGQKEREEQGEKEVLRDPRSTPKPFRTLAELLAESTGHKRGRQMTHYDGIPISIIRSSRPTTPTQTRQTVTPRRLRLRQCFDDLKIEHTMEAGTDRKGQDKGHSAKDTVMNVNSSDEEQCTAGREDESSDSSEWPGGEDESDDDDDDVVFII